MAKKSNLAFTLIELLVVIAIIGLLASISFLAIKEAYRVVYFNKSKAELRSIAQAIHLYMLDHNFDYPPDVVRDMPSGLEEYLTSNPRWPKAPWADSFYDWDYWDSDPGNPDAGSLSFPPEGEVYQISIRFCKYDQPETCRFPDEEWAADFDYWSSAYWCVSGPCRAHGSKPFDHPGCCIGGGCQPGAVLCQ